jgi:UDP-glucose 4-epimerase
MVTVRRAAASLTFPDAVGALVALADNPNATGEVYNIGSTQEVRILELANRIKELTGSDSQIQLVPYHVAYEEGFEDMMRRVPNLDKLNALIGYKPTFSLDQILESVIAFERSKMRARPQTPAA